MDIVGVDQESARVRGAGERTIIILVDQWDPILHEGAEYTDDGRVRNLVGEVLQLRPEYEQEMSDVSAREYTALTWSMYPRSNLSRGTT